MENEKEVVTEGSSKSDIDDSCKSTFKKPVLIGKIGRLPRKLTSMKSSVLTNKVEVKDTLDAKEKEVENNKSPEVNAKSFTTPVQQLENSLALPYKEPKWSGLPQSANNDYAFEVLKSGVIVENINLMSKSFWVFGRSVTCEICLAHPTISRYHAVLQYRREGSEDNPPGFYIYDLSSTHGTFLNKRRLKPRVYAPLKVGHLIKLGFSTRSYVLLGPEEDREEESKLTLTELKKQRTEKFIQRELELKEALLKEESEKEERQKRLEEHGVDWGLSEDADEDSDITENPFAQTNNEELYIDDPKKALRGFMEREGYTLEYICTEQGFGQFLCKVELPIDDDHGRRIIAEVLHKGKKKEAVVQCALEACSILDRHGVLRQAIHESRKRKARNWEENDYYDSDDDTFLDRTGTIEKKREKRMQSKIPQQPETYQSLVEKDTKISLQIKDIEKQLARAKQERDRSEATEEDPLDSFMKKLKDSKPNKQTISKLKLDLAMLKNEHINIVKLVNLAKPVDLPPLLVSNVSSIKQVEPSTTSKSILPIFGKRKKIKVEKPHKVTIDKTNDEDDNEDEEEEELSWDKLEDEESIKRNDLSQNANTLRIILSLENMLKNEQYPDVINEHIEDVEERLSELKILIQPKEISPENLIAKNRNVKKGVCNYNEDHLLKVCKELKKLYLQLQSVVEVKYEVHSKIRILMVKLDLSRKQILKEIVDFKKRQNIDQISTKSSKQVNEDEEEIEKQISLEEQEKRKKKNQKRNIYRKEKNEIEKQKGYEEDAQKEDYNMWVPPQNQTGDGRTTLNEKYGY